MTEEDEIWQLRSADEAVVNQLVTELDITPITAKILANRGYDQPQQVVEFLDCSIQKMHDPYLFKDMKEAVNRITQALSKQEKIVVYGDYDVDGITSTALLINYLQDCNAQIEFYIPNRLTEGYGLNKSAVQKLADDNVDLLITVDCGIKAQPEIELANNLGLDVIVTDHHTVPEQLPPAEAVLNPKRSDANYPCAELAGVAVAFKLVQALEIAREDAVMPVARKYLALVTLGVVADIVPLRDENRLIAKEGLKQLEKITKEQPGLFALAEVAGCLDGEISTGHVGYGLAPRINACGRLGQPELGVDLLLSSNYEEAQELAQELDSLNDRRQEMSREMQEEAEALIEQLDLEKNWVLVLASENWHSGVIGNVASDLNEKYHRPVVLIAIEENNVGKGSARSISGFNIHDALLAQQDLLIAFGGHKQAAGLSIASEQIEVLKKRLNQYAKQQLTAKDLVPRKKVDAAVNLAELSFSLVQELDHLAPFGCANPSPKLIVEDIKISDYKLVGSDENHLKFTAQDSEIEIDGIAFSQPEVKSKLDVKAEGVALLFSPEINCWRGQKKLQLKTKAIKVPFDSSLEQVFARNKNNEQDAFTLEQFIKLVETESQNRQQVIQNLSRGQKLKLHSNKNNDQNPQVKVLTAENNLVGYLPETWSGIARKLEVGVKYEALTAEIIKEQDSLVVQILLKKAPALKFENQQLKELKNQVKNKSEFEALDYLQRKLYNNSPAELIEQVKTALTAGEDILNIINPSQNKAQLSLVSATWKSLQHDKMSILVYPFKSVLEQRFPVIAEKLSSLGLQVCKASSSLTDSEEITLQAKLYNQECDLLVTTPQFLKTDLINLNKLSSAVELMIIEEIDYFVNHHLAQLLTETITKLGSMQLIGYTSSITKAVANQVLKKFNFDKQVISNYNKPPLKLKDKRNSNDKLKHLKQLLKQQRQVVVYVNQQSQSEKIVHKLHSDNSTSNNNIAYYHQNLTKADQALIRDKFMTAEINMLIATPAFNEVWGIKNIDVIVFYEPCFNKYNCKYLANQAVKSDVGELQLLYQSQEVEANKELLKQVLPTRELLKELYIILYKNKTEAGKVTVSQQDLLYELNNRLKLQINNKFLLNCLNIFEELDLIQRTKGKGGKIQLLDKPDQKLDLCSSMRYNECVILKEVFSYLENLTSKDEGEFLKSITETYSTTLKGERNIEFSR